MSEPSKKPNLKEAYRELAPWKRRLHLVALVLIVLGLGMKGLSLATGGGSKDSGAIVSGNPKSEVATKTGGALDPTGNAFLPTPTGKTGEIMLMTINLPILLVEINFVPVIIP